uniref:Zinc transporter ZupT n=1 Tax=candidate division WOR-3 bacterium TaxID=2052148 RepID=A0A7C4GJZ6_UNCW3
MHANFVYALVLSAVAGTATVLGSLVAFAVRRPGARFMAFSLGFSAGVMLLVSFAELLRTGIESLGFMPALLAFFAGLGLMFLVDVLVPHVFVAEQGPVEDKGQCFGQETAAGPGRHRWRGGRPAPDPSRLLRTGLLVAVGIGIHNLPEGMATFAGALKSRGLGLAIAGAIALHNIPEGLAVAVPVFCATGSRRKALWWSALSGMSELAGALLAAAVMMPFLSDRLLNVMLAGVAGLMVFISLDELIPGSYAYGHEHMSVAGIALGMMVMAASVWLLM